MTTVRIRETKLGHRVGGTCTRPQHSHVPVRQLRLSLCQPLQVPTRLKSLSGETGVRSLGRLGQAATASAHREGLPSAGQYGGTDVIRLVAGDAIHNSLEFVAKRLLRGGIVQESRDVGSWEGPFASSPGPTEQRMIMSMYES
jgi:hypothetical protein